VLKRVIKVGGRVQGDPGLGAAIVDAWRAADGALCVVHGGGDEISALQRSLGVEPRFVGGRRVTTEADLDLLRMALSGSANKRLIARIIDAGAPAVGLSGEDAGLVIAEPVSPAELGRVGRPMVIRASLIDLLTRGGYLPVISPVSRGADGAPLNVNGDDAAAAIAAATGASELLLLADVPGVRDGTGVIRSLDADGAKALIASGIADGGMAAKLEAAIRAARSGVPVRIGDLSALGDPGAGTLVLTEAGSLA
jgi:acetylglutamate kinase